MVANISNPRKTAMRSLLAVCLAAAAWAQNDSRQTGDNPHGHAQPDPPTVDLGHGQELRDSLMSGGAGVLTGILIGRAMNRGPKPEKVLSEQGPQFPTAFSMSTITVLGFASGNWPVALDYEIRQPGFYLLTVTVPDGAPFLYVLDGSKMGRRMEILRLPRRFGSTPVPATFSLRAIATTAGEARPVYMRVFGWACGAKAVGSVAIDQLRFGPGSVKRKQNQFAVYGFHSHADFEKVTAEFEAVGLIDGNVVARLEDTQTIEDPVRINTEIANKRWDVRKASGGQHLLQVRAWFSEKKGGDWVIAWSPGIVRVED